jgi:hypothetical protein
MTEQKNQGSLLIKEALAIQKCYYNINRKVPNLLGVTDKGERWTDASEHSLPLRP